MANPLDRLLDDLRADALRPRDNHIDVEEAVAYTMDTIDADAMARVEAHLQWCGECAVRVEHLMTLSSHWATADGRRELDALARRVRRSVLTRPATARRTLAQSLI